jgi:uncharacterized Tic20 family protein
MKNELAFRIKEIRKHKGYSQEELSEKSGLSIRTIQRIENGESDPRGDTLKKLANSLEVLPDEIMDWGLQEDNGFLTNLNLSALTFILFPVLGIIVPLVLWISRKDKIKDVNKVARSVLNFQLSWTMFLFIGFIVIFGSTISTIEKAGEISFQSINSRIIMIVGYLALMYLINVVLILLNTTRINRGEKVRYFLCIRFLRHGTN